MGAISSSTGLISGMDIESIVTSLMKIEHRSVDLLSSKKSKLESEQAAMMTLSAKLLSLKLTATNLKTSTTFRPRSVTSSDESILTASVTSSANLGTYSFRVRQIAQSHQMISQGFADPEHSAIGEGSLTFEIGNGRLDRETELNLLNGNQGVRRGVIRITDRSGASADIDLSDTITVADVIEKINNASNIDVTASTQSDRIVLTDSTGQTVSDLIVEDVGDGFAAADLGIVGSVAGTTLTGEDLVSLVSQTAFDLLNDGNGVRTSDGADLSITLRDGSSFNVDLAENLTLDTPLSLLNNGKGVDLDKIKITDRDENETVIDLSSAVTISDVVNAIQDGTDDKISVVVTSDSLRILDKTEGDGELKVENFNGSTTATDLGIEGEADEGENDIQGEQIFSVLMTVGSAIQAIQVAADRELGEGMLTAQIAADGKRIELIDTTGGTGQIQIASIDGSGTAEDLGIAGTYDGTNTVSGQRLISGMNTVLLKSLNGGSGVGAGQITIQDRTGASTVLDLSGAETLQDVIDAINDSGAINVEASLNSTGVGLSIKDMTGSTAANFSISGTMADDLGITVDDAVTQIDSGNNQVQYISETTLLSDLNNGKGISAGTFTITDSSGKFDNFRINASEDMTVGDLIEMINDSDAIDVQASINDTGDGILITDLAAGANTLKIADSGTGRTAADLRLAGEADESGAGTIDGSYEYRIEISAGDTLESLVEKLDELGAPIQASIINDGTGVNAYRLSLSSKISGKDGQIVFSGGDTSLRLFDLIEPKDAIMTLGGAESSSSLVVTSSSNTFKNVLPGMTINVHAASDTPVTLNVTQNTEKITEAISKFVTGFNEIIDLIDDLTDYNAETEKSGVLLGSSTVNSVKSRLYGTLRQTLNVSGVIGRISQLGISVGSGAKLTFDQEKLEEVFNNEPEAVSDFFTFFDYDKYREAVADGTDAVDKFYTEEPMGLAHLFDRLLDNLTKSDGLIGRSDSTYDRRIDLIDDRIEYLEELLDKKEERLYTQFYNMELALSKMQSMQDALSSITAITMNKSSSSSSSKS